MKKRDVSVGMIYYRCRVCAEVVETHVMYNAEPSITEAQHIDNLDGTNHWSDNLCAECLGQKETGVMFVVYDEDLTDSLDDPFRLGLVFTVSFDDALNFIDEIPECGYIYVSNKKAREYGFPVDEEE